MQVMPTDISLGSYLRSRMLPDAHKLRMSSSWAARTNLSRVWIVVVILDPRLN